MGWCTKSVDSLADRLCFKNFDNDIFEVNEIFERNNPDVFFDSAILSALIGSCCFVYISQSNEEIPNLLEKVLDSFDDGIKNSVEFKWAMNVVKNKTADYKTANELAKEIGNILSNGYKLNINSSVLPDGKMYFNIADRIIRPTMEKAHEIIANYSADIQTQLNHSAGLKIKGITPELNADRIDGIVNKISRVDDFEKVSWLLDEPIKNFCQSVVDDTIQKNVKHHHKLGLKPKVVRITSGKCCVWCDKLAGSYKYPDVPNDVYRRHLRCDCIVEYHPGDGKKQDVHSKKWTDVEKRKLIETRKTLNRDMIFNSKVKLLATQKILKLKNIEPKVTAHLKEIANKTGGKMVGLDFRLKTRESLIRKILTDVKETGLSFDDVSRNIKDVLRYTIVYDEDYFVERYFEVLEKFNKKGYNVIRIKNTFKNNEVYKGINTIVRDEKGNLFEL